MSSFARHWSLTSAPQSTVIYLPRKMASLKHGFTSLREWLSYLSRRLRLQTLNYSPLIPLVSTLFSLTRALLCSHCRESLLPPFFQDLSCHNFTLSSSMTFSSVISQLFIIRKNFPFRGSLAQFWNAPILIERPLSLPSLFITKLSFHGQCSYVTHLQMVLPLSDSVFLDFAFWLFPFVHWNTSLGSQLPSHYQLQSCFLVDFIQFDNSD